MNLKEYAQQCSLLQEYRRKCKKLGPGTPEAVSKPIMDGVWACLESIKEHEQSMFKSKRLK